MRTTGENIPIKRQILAAARAWMKSENSHVDYNDPKFEEAMASSIPRLTSIVGVDYRFWLRRLYPP